MIVICKPKWMAPWENLGCPPPYIWHQFPRGNLYIAPAKPELPWKWLPNTQILGYPSSIRSVTKRGHPCIDNPAPLLPLCSHSLHRYVAIQIFSALQGRSPTARCTPTSFTWSQASTNLTPTFSRSMCLQVLRYLELGAAIILIFCQSYKSAKRPGVEPWSQSSLKFCSWYWSAYSCLIILRYALLYWSLILALSTQVSGQNEM